MIIGPGIAGIMVVVNPALAFAVSALASVLSVGALCLVKTDRQRVEDQNGSVGYANEANNTGTTSWQSLIADTIAVFT
jgi:hypothetical protein